MLAMYWPIALIVLSNTFYHLSSKSTPSSVNPLASLTVTYLVGAVLSGVLYFVLNRGGNLINEYKNLNWSSYVLGLCIVGLEAGYIYLYKSGWNISTAQLICSSALAVVLIFVGYFVYHENITPTKIVGVLICMVGLYFINR